MFQSQLSTHHESYDPSKPISSGLSIEDKPDLVFNHAQIYYDGTMHYLVEPSHYDVTIEPFLQKSHHTKGVKRQFTYKGTVQILMRVRQEIDSIVLGAMDLSVEKLTLKKLRNYQPFVSIFFQKSKN